MTMTTDCRRQRQRRRCKAGLVAMLVRATCAATLLFGSSILTAMATTSSEINHFRSLQSRRQQYRAPVAFSSFQAATASSSAFVPSSMASSRNVGTKSRPLFAEPAQEDDGGAFFSMASQQAAQQRKKDMRAGKEPLSFVATAKAVVSEVQEEATIVAPGDANVAVEDGGGDAIESDDAAADSLVDNLKRKGKAVLGDPAYRDLLSTLGDAGFVMDPPKDKATDTKGETSSPDATSVDETSVDAGLSDSEKETDASPVSKSRNEEAFRRQLLEARFASERQARVVAETKAEEPLPSVEEVEEEPLEEGIKSETEEVAAVEEETTPEPEVESKVEPPEGAIETETEEEAAVEEETTPEPEVELKVEPPGEAIETETEEEAAVEEETTPEPEVESKVEPPEEAIETETEEVAAVEEETTPEPEVELKVEPPGEAIETETEEVAVVEEETTPEPEVESKVEPPEEAIETETEEEATPEPEVESKVEPPEEEEKSGEIDQDRVNKALAALSQSYFQLQSAVLREEFKKLGM